MGTLCPVKCGGKGILIVKVGDSLKGWDIFASFMTVATNRPKA